MQVPRESRCHILKITDQLICSWWRMQGQECSSLQTVTLCHTNHSCLLPHFSPRHATRKASRSISEASHTSRIQTSAHKDKAVRCAAAHVCGVGWAGGGQSARPRLRLDWAQECRMWWVRQQLCGVSITFKASGITAFACLTRQVKHAHRWLCRPAAVQNHYWEQWRNAGNANMHSATKVCWDMQGINPRAQPGISRHL